MEMKVGQIMKKIIDKLFFRDKLKKEIEQLKQCNKVLQSKNVDIMNRIEDYAGVSRINNENITAYKSLVKNLEDQLELARRDSEHLSDELKIERDFIYELFVITTRKPDIIFKSFFIASIIYDHMHTNRGKENKGDK